MKKTLLLFVILWLVGGWHSFAQQDSTIQKFPILKAELQLRDSLPTILSQNQNPPLWKNQHDWISYQMKVSLKTEDEDLAFQCFMVNRTDSLIYFNLHKSGIELMRVVLTPDSVILVNKLQKEYYRGNYQLFKAIFNIPLTFTMIQAILNGTDFTECEGRFSTVAEEQQIKYIWPQRQCGTMAVMQEITADKNGLLLRNDLTELASGREVLLTYNNPRLEEVNFTPEAAEAQMKPFALFDGFTLTIASEEVTLKADISKLKVNVPGPTSIKIPDSFTPMQNPNPQQ